MITRRLAALLLAALAAACATDADRPPAYDYYGYPYGYAPYWSLYGDPFFWPYYSFGDCYYCGGYYGYYGYSGWYYRPPYRGWGGHPGFPGPGSPGPGWGRPPYGGGPWHPRPGGGGGFHPAPRPLPRPHPAPHFHRGR